MSLVNEGMWVGGGLFVVSLMSWSSCHVPTGLVL